jgi:replicative DNA helicase
MEPRRSPEDFRNDIKNEEYIAWEEKMNKVAGTADVIIAKQRHGPTGTARLSFVAQFTRFGDLAEDDHLPEQYE